MRYLCRPGDFAPICMQPFYKSILANHELYKYTGDYRQELYIDVMSSFRFSFNLNPDWELAGLTAVAASQQSSKQLSKRHHNTASLASLGTNDTVPIQEGVRDMLVKHHLFSWDL